MTDDADDLRQAGTVATVSDATPELSTPSSPDAPAPSLPARIVALSRRRPEFVVGAAFAGGVVLATIIKRLARR